MILEKSSVQKFTQFILIYQLLFFVAIFPIWYMDFLPLSDYPNHLSRMHIIAHINQSQYLKEYYQIQWNIIPNLGIDLFVPFLVKILGADLAGKITIGLTFFLITSGVFALNFSLFKKLSYFPFLSFIVLYNTAFSFGFINFLFMLGIGLWSIATWISLRDKPLKLRFFIGSIISTILFIGHAYAVGVYALVVIGYESYHLFDRRKKVSFDSRSIFSISTVVFGQFLPPLALYLISPSSDESFHENKFQYVSIATKFGLQYLGSLGDYYNVSLSRITFVVVLILPIIAILLGVIRVSKEMLPSLGLLLIFYLL